MNPTEIEEYIAGMPFAEDYYSLPDEIKPKLIAECWNMLRRRYGAAVITSEMAALQTVYIAEGEKEEFSKFKRQSVKSFGLDGISFSFDLDHVSPEVVALIEQLQKGTVATGGPIFGRLI